MTKEIIIQRLSRIKHLYFLGVEQSKKDDLISFTAILCFHDAIDMFMELASVHKQKTDREKKQVTNGRTNLFMMEYFSLIPELTHETSVKKINSRRNSLKHEFQLIAKSEIEESAVIAKLFFEENTKIVFDIEFDEVSMLELITDELIKNLLKEAEDLIRTKEYRKASENTAKAFLLLSNKHKAFVPISGYYDHMPRFQKDFPDRMFFTIRRLATELNQSKNMKVYNEVDVFDKRIDGLIRKYDNNFKTVSFFLELLSLGVQHKKYTQFVRCTPFVDFNDDGTFKILQTTEDKDLNETVLRFQIDFVLDCCLKVQSLE